MKIANRSQKRSDLGVKHDLWKINDQDVEIHELVKDLKRLVKSLTLTKHIKICAAKTTTGRGQRNLRSAQPSPTAVGELLTFWHQDPRYLDKFGNPIPLRIAGKGPSFRALARNSAPNISANYLLEELLRLRVINVDSAGLVRATTRSLPVYNDAELAKLHTVRALRGFIRTLDHNLSRGSSNVDQLFHRIAWNGDLPIQHIPRLKIWLQRHGQDFLEAADNWMQNNSRSRQRRPLRRRHGIQTSIGIYLAIDKR